MRLETQLDIADRALQNLPEPVFNQQGGSNYFIAKGKNKYRQALDELRAIPYFREHVDGVLTLAPFQIAGDEFTLLNAPQAAEFKGAIDVLINRLRSLCDVLREAVTSLVERAEARSERFEGYSERRGTEAERARAAVSAIADNIPFGQPILVGHHSERHARRDRPGLSWRVRRRHLSGGPVMAAKAQQLVFAALADPEAPVPREREFVIGVRVDRSGIARYLHLTRDPNDPERSPRPVGGRADRAPPSDAC